MRVVRSLEIAAPPEAVWAWVSDPERQLRFWHGLTRWEVVSEQTTGVGARYRMLLHVGAADVGSLVEVVESEEARDLAWTSITGIDQRGRWRLRPRDLGHGIVRTRIELRLAYGVAGAGIPGWIAEQVSKPQVRSHLQATLVELKRQVEHEQLRLAAQARRRARASAVDAAR